MRDPVRRVAVLFLDKDYLTRLHPQGKGGAKRPYSLTNRDYDSFNTTDHDDVTTVIERFGMAIMTQDEQDCHFLTVFGSVIWRSHE